MAFFLDRLIREKQVETEQTPQHRIPQQAGVALALYALAGGIALGYEVVWSQAIVQFLSTKSFAFSIVLATYLAGLVVGSALYARFAARVRDPWSMFGLLIASAGLIALLEIAGLSIWQLKVQAEIGHIAFVITHSEFAGMCARFAVAALGIVFVPTVLLGAAFPAALRLAAREQRIGRDVGAVLALNTAGGIAGTLLTGFFLVPTLGLVHTLAVLAIGAAAIGIVAVLRGPMVQRSMWWAVFAIACAAILGGIFTPADRLGRLLTTTRGGGSVVFYDEKPRRYGRGGARAERS
jgi:spermidine synthase